MTHPFGLLRQRNIILQYYVEHSMFIIGQIKCSWLLPHRQAICFSSLIWLSRNKSVKNLVSRELLRILENFHFSISISKHFDFTFHFSKKSESILISLCTSRKRVKAFFFHFALLEKEWKLFIFTFHFSNFKNPLSLVPAVCSQNIVRMKSESSQNVVSR